MSDTWRSLARLYGRRSVMDLTITEDAMDAETERQWTILAPMLRPLLNGSERLALDYGCGAGRFTGRLADLTAEFAIGYDPCKDLLYLAPPHRAVNYTAQLPLGMEFDLIFAAMVLGDPNADPAAMASEIASLLAPDGLLVVLDHMPDEPPAGRWWQFHSVPWFRDLFASAGIPLDEIGSLTQLSNPVTVLAGRNRHA
jgi:SAM-dependent methyltransferase